SEPVGLWEDGIEEGPSTSNQHPTWRRRVDPGPSGTSPATPAPRQNRLTIRAPDVRDPLGTYGMGRALPDPRRRPEAGSQRWSRSRPSGRHVRKGRLMSDKPERGPRLPPRWFVRLAWSVHRGLYRVTRARVGLPRPKGDRWGTLRLTTTGRRTGRKHGVIIAYLEDGPNLIAMAM